MRMTTTLKYSPVQQPRVHDPWLASEGTLAKARSKTAQVDTTVPRWAQTRRREPQNKLTQRLQVCSSRIPLD